MKTLYFVVSVFTCFNCFGISEIETAGKLFEVLKMEQLLTQKAITYKEQMDIVLEQSDFSEEEVAEVRAEASIIIDEMINFLKSEEVLNEFMKSYSETFTEEELQDLIDFYSSSTGRKFLEQSGELNKNFMKKISPQFSEILGELQRAMSAN